MAGQRINIMEIRSLIALKLKGLSNRKVADLLKINRKTVDNYTSRFSGNSGETEPPFRETEPVCGLVLK